MAGPRSIWNGTVAFAGVFVPVKVHSATDDKQVHFHQVHVDDGARIEHKRICPKEDKEVPYKEIVKGYEVSEAGTWCSRRRSSTRPPAQARG